MFQQLWPPLQPQSKKKKKDFTLQEVQHQDGRGDAFGRDLDPPLEEERVEQNPDNAFTGQSSPWALRLGLAKRGACMCLRTNTESPKDVSGSSLAYSLMSSVNNLTYET